MSEINAYMNGYQPMKDNDYLVAALDAHKNALDKTEQKVRRFEKALKFYADRSTYNYYKIENGLCKTKIDEDTGDIARQALEAEGIG
jgi:hypothetical protein